MRALLFISFKNDVAYGNKTFATIRNPKTLVPPLNASLVGQETLDFQSPNVLFPSFNA